VQRVRPQGFPTSPPYWQQAAAAVRGVRNYYPPMIDKLEQDEDVQNV
jgi:hypothetical protein